jgi:hypothetical protein
MDLYIFNTPLPLKKWINNTEFGKKEPMLRSTLCENMTLQNSADKGGINTCVLGELILH